MQTQLFQHQPPAGGPIYQGVSAQMRELFPKDDAAAQAKKRQLKGWISLALAHARTLDSAHGASVGRAQTSAELREVLTAIGDAVATGDQFEEFLEELRTNGGAAPAHAPE